MASPSTSAVADSKTTDSEATGSALASFKLFIKALLFGLLSLIAISLVFLAIFGVGAKTFFFVQQFCFDYLKFPVDSIPWLDIADILSAAIGSSMFLAYVFSIGPSVAWHLRTIFQKLFGTEEAVKPVVEKKVEYTLSSKYRLALTVFAAIACVIGSITIGVGGGLGVLTIYDAATRTFSYLINHQTIFYGFAWASGACMLVAFGGFSVQMALANLSRLWTKTNDPVPLTEAVRFEKAMSYEDTKQAPQSVTQRVFRSLVSTLYIPIALGATVGTTAFLFFPFIHFLTVTLALSSSVVTPIFIIGLTGLFAYNGICTGLKIWQDGADYLKDKQPSAAQKVAAGAIHKMGLGEQVGRKAAWGYMGLTGIIRSIGVVMGIVVIFAAIGTTPGLNLLAIGLGVAAGVCSLVEYLCYYGPTAVDTMVGQPWKTYHPVAEGDTPKPPAEHGASFKKPASSSDYVPASAGLLGTVAGNNSVDSSASAALASSSSSSSTSTTTSVRGLPAAGSLKLAEAIRFDQHPAPTHPAGEYLGDGSAYNPAFV